LGGECRVDVITSSQTFLSQCNTLSFTGLFKKFWTLWYALSYGIHSMHSSNAFSSVHFPFCAFFYHSFWFLSYMAVTAAHFSCAICWSNYIVAQSLSAAVPRELHYIPQRDRLYQWFPNRG